MASTVENLRITTEFSVRLAVLLRLRGVAVGTQQLMACMRAIVLLGSVNEEELQRIYRITLINRKQDLWHLYRAYEFLLKEYESAGESQQGEESQRERAHGGSRRHGLPGEGVPAETTDEPAATQGYSTREVDHLQDLRRVPRENLPAVMAALTRIARGHASLARRRARRARRRGQMELRRTLRESVKSGGEIMKWRYKRKRPTRSRVVIVSDVSGSMEIYSIFLLNFLYLLNSARCFRMETFVFSTRLEDLTRPFRSRNFPEMLKNVALHFSAWSGGTKIGAALETLNRGHDTAITPKTTVVIMSDGWDTGEADLLDREMCKLRNRARSVIWINPLKGAPAYEPLALGMSTALPYCDEFITGHSLDSMAAFARLLTE